MQVRMRFLGSVRWYHHLPDFQLMVEDGTTLGCLLTTLGVNMTDGIVTVNGKPAAVGYQLAAGDDIVVRRRGEAFGPIFD